jgi:anthranilate/para-aminobenzoate synthase component II
MSPGPGCPDDFNAPAVIGELAKRGIPVFGVCLGLQSMVQFFGGKLDILPTPVHGKPYNVSLTNGGGYVHQTRSDAFLFDDDVVVVDDVVGGCV